MFDYIRNNSRVLFFVLVLLIIPSFVFFGVQGYTQFVERNEPVAKVAGERITQMEFDAAYRNHIDRLQQQMPGMDVKLLDTPEMKERVLEALVRERVLVAAAQKLYMTTADTRLHRIFTTDPQFAALRNDDGTVNKDRLASLGMTSAQFAQRLGWDLAVNQVLRSVEGSAMGAKAVSDLALDAFLQEREIQVRRFNAREQAAKVDPSDEALQAYYKDPANADQFKAPEEASIEYVVLSMDTVRQGIQVSEDDLRKYYEQNADRYTTPLERRASHILVKAERDAPAEEREKAQAKARSLLEQVRANPASFAELAKQHSDDPGSAASGGDLDFFGRGAMVKPFEDAAFSLGKGQVSDLVETDFGFHIIQVTDERGGQKKAFEEVRAELEEEVRNELAQSRYAELAEQFSNLVYEQSDSLQPAAEKLGLQIRKAEHVTRTPAPDAQGPLASASFLEAVFSEDAVTHKRNTEAVEVGRQQLAAARIVSHTPARVLPFDEVKVQVREAVIAREAAALARKEGEEKLAAWKQAPDSATLDAAVKVSRVQPGALPRAIIDAALNAKADQLPAWVGVDLGDEGYAVVRVNKVVGRAQVPGAEQLPAQYAQAWAAAESNAYYEALKKRFKAEVVMKPKADATP
jgi:peptidyl-prolyl cis-trans isomerase D